MPQTDLSVVLLPGGGASCELVRLLAGTICPPAGLVCPLAGLVCPPNGLVCPLAGLVSPLAGLVDPQAGLACARGERRAGDWLGLAGELELNC